MSNVIQFTGTYRQPQQQQKSFCDAVIERARTYAAMPASITRNRVLNHALTELQKRGWKVKAHPNGTAQCTHPVLHPEPLDTFNAWRIQRAAEYADGGDFAQ